MRLAKVLAAAALCLFATACATTADRDIVAQAESPAGAVRAAPMPSARLDSRRVLRRIVFASCFDPKAPDAIWDRITGERPDLVLLLGDNVYGDVRSGDAALPELKAAYMRLGASPAFARLRERTPVLAVWDDHDYGANDAGADFPLRERSEALFEHVWAIPATDPRRARPGVYGDFLIGPDGRRVHVVLLDARFFRSPLKATDQRDARGKERYVPDADPSKTMLGAAQWAWLAEELRKPADLTIVASSIQVLSEGHGFEAWKQLPAERDRLLALLRGANTKELLIVSGDRHFGALYRRGEGKDGAPLLEATASSLNLPSSRWRAESGDTYIEPDPGRLGDPVFDVNYGVVDIDWDARSAKVSVRDAAGESVRSAGVAIPR